MIGLASVRYFLYRDKKLQIPRRKWALECQLRGPGQRHSHTVPIHPEIDSVFAKVWVYAQTDLEDGVCKGAGGQCRESEERSKGPHVSYRYYSPEASYRSILTWVWQVFI